MGVAQLEAALKDSDTFSADVYRVEIPEIEGHAARNIGLRFSGSARFDRTSADDVALLQAARLGREVGLIVTGTVATKTYALDTSGEEMSYAFVVRVEGVEAGELV